jgi:hypothetical protein
MSPQGDIIKVARQIFCGAGVLSFGIVIINGIVSV